MLQGTVIIYLTLLSLWEQLVTEYVSFTGRSLGVRENTNVVIRGRHRTEINRY